MKDYNQDPTFDDKENGIINVVIEIPFGSTEKIEWSRKTKQMEFNRQEPSKFAEPVNYGFVPKTTGGDSDNLDVLCISELVMQTGTVLAAKIIGVMKFIDEGQTDDKIVIVPAGDDKINSLSDIDHQDILRITDYFNHYKDYIQLGLTTVLGWGDATQAKKVLDDSINRFDNHN